MARRPVEKAPPPKKPPTWLGWAVGLPFRIAGVLVLSILSSIVIEWAGIYFQWWSLPGAAHARADLASAIGWIDTQYTRSLIFNQPVETAQWCLGLAYHYVFGVTGAAAWLSANAHNDGLAGALATYGQAAVDVSLIVLVRVVILILTLPLFGMAAFVGTVDGLVRRDLRRFGAGRESAFVYHHAKRLTGPVFVAGWLIYLSLPFSIYPDAFLVPCAALFGLMLSVTIGSFKKYL
ncbi:MAG: TIGR03747 family integrating conjugative element membrane protein [Salinisphaera sp.]|jgi:integrating conjugative element membrane protein (TIGR03747 family)|nr:TIGR03747 family integrating conjugative element membrane protein [Salinisphaera sp.]